MKIMNAWIDDPTQRGELEKPMLCVHVDSMPDVTIEPESFAGGWSVGKYGPFVKYEGPSPVDSGDFNVRFRNRFPVVVDIVLFVDGLTQVPGFSLPLTRARQLVRKYDPNWRLLISDRAGEQGAIMWLPVESNPTCHWWMKDDICGKRPARIIRVSDVDMPLCDAHLRKHNENFAAKRAART